MNLIPPFLFFFCLLLNTSASDSTSALHVLLEELSLVSRVTNAIALQSYGTRKKLNPSQIVAELLKMSNTSSAEFRGIETGEMKNTIPWILHEMKTLTETGVIGAQTSEYVREDLGTFIRLGELLVENAPTMTVAALATEMKALDKNDLTFCEDPKDWDSLLLLMSNQSTARQTNEMFRKFESSTTKLLNCFEEQNGKYEKALRKFTDVFEKTSYFIKCELIAQQLFNSFDDYLSIGSQLAEVKVFAKNVTTFWSANDRNQWRESRKAMAIVDNSFGSWRNITAPSLPTVAGFRSLEDVQKVEDDVRDEAFLRIIAKKNKTEMRMLLKSLTPFRTFSTAAKALNSSWGSTIEKYQELEDGMQIGHIRSFVDLIWSFNTIFEKNNMNVLGSVKDLKAGIERCWENNTFHSWAELENHTVNFTKLFGKFEKATTPFRNVFSTLEKLVGAFNDVRKNTTLIGEFKNFTNEVVKAFNDDPISKRSNTFDTFKSHELFEVFKSVIRSAEKIQSIENYVKMIYPNFTQASLSSDMNIQLFWDDTKLKEILECALKLRPHDKHMFDVLRFLANFKILPPMNTLLQADAMYGKLPTIFNDIRHLEQSMDTWKKMDPLLARFINPMEVSQRFAKGLNVVHEMEEIKHSESLLMSISTLLEDREVNAFLRRWTYQSPDFIHTWLETDSKERLGKKLSELKALDPIAAKVRKDSSQMDVLFTAASKLKGIPVDESVLKSAIEKLRQKFPAEAELMEKVSKLKLDFASYEGNLIGALTSYDKLLAAYDIMYGHNSTRREEKGLLNSVKSVSYLLTIILSVIAGVIFIFIIIFIFVKTKRGRRIYKKWYLYYFGKEEDFEKLWRYSYFLDTVNGENILDATVCLANSKKLKEVLRKGAYVDAYNIYGNTALHTCVKSINALANDEFVEMAKILITHGADRNLLNFENRTAEQLIAWKPPLVSKRSVEMSDVFSKYREKQFRLHVPMEFDSSFFQIYCGHHLDHQSAEKFIETFKSLASDEVVPATTHVVVVVNKEGFLETDDFVMLSWIFLGYIIVKEKWIEDCIKDKDLLDDDEKYLVEGVKYNGVEYPNVVLPWTESFAKSMMPYLLGVQIVLFYTQCPFYARLKSVVSKLGGTVLQEVPETFNQNARPYLHANRNAVWIVHDGTCDVTAYENDRQGRFSVLTEQEFVVLLLQRKIVRDTTVYPIYAAEPKSNT